MRQTWSILPIPIAQVTKVSCGRLNCWLYFLTIQSILVVVPIAQDVGFCQETQNPPTRSPLGRSPSEIAEDAAYKARRQTAMRLNVPETQIEMVDQFKPPSAASTGQLMNATIQPLTNTFKLNVTPREISLREAIQTALMKSEVVRTLGAGGVQIEALTSFDPMIARARADAAGTVFDPKVTAGYLGSRINEPSGTFFGPGITQITRRDEGDFTASLSKTFATGATASIGYLPPLGYLFYPSGVAGQFNPVYTSDLVAQVQQPLLRGAGWVVNTAPIKIAQLRAEQSTWDIKQLTLAQVRSVENAYWDLQAALVSLNAIESVLPLMAEIVRIEGHRADAEISTTADLARATMQYDLLQQQAIGMRNDALAKELRLRNLLALEVVDGTRLLPIDLPLRKQAKHNLTEIIGNAIENRPDLVRMRLGVRIRELEYEVARNGLKPQLDLQALYRSNGIGQGLDSSLQQMLGFAYSDVTLGATFSIPLGNRAAKANHQAAEFQLTRDRVVLNQTIQNISFGLADLIRESEAAFSQYELALHRVQNSNEWIRSAQIRYSTPPASADGNQNWLLLALYDYQNALKMHVDATTDAGQLLAKYNTQLARLEESQGILLENRGVELADDPIVTVVKNSDKLFGGKPPADPPFKDANNNRVTQASFEQPSPPDQSSRSTMKPNTQSIPLEDLRLQLSTRSVPDRLPTAQTPRSSGSVQTRGRLPSPGYSLGADWNTEGNAIRPANYSTLSGSTNRETRSVP